MKIEKKHINLIFILLGVAVLVLTYTMGVSKLNERTEELETENGRLRNEEQVLSRLEMNAPDYRSQTSEMKEFGETLLTVFPPEVRTEDQILYAARLEAIFGHSVSYIATPSTEYLNIPMPARENELLALSDVTGAIAANSNVNYDNVLSAEGMVMGITASTNTFTCTYDQFKNMIIYICEDSDIKAVDNINLTYDSSTGNLSGTMTIYYYTMLGTGRGYSEPFTAVGGYGVDGIFGTLTGSLGQ